MKTLCLICLLVVLACSRAFGAFPTEEQVRSRLRKGMTTKQVTALYGTPGGGTADGYGEERVFSYRCPFASLTREEEGYAGFKIIFKNDRLVDWQPIRSKPSYDPAIHNRRASH